MYVHHAALLAITLAGGPQDGGLPLHPKLMYLGILGNGAERARVCCEGHALDR